MRVIVIILGLVLSPLTWGKALYQDNSDFAKACIALDDKDAGVQELTNFTFCHGFTSGVTHTLHALKSVYPVINYCRPDNVTDGQIMKVVAKYIENNPQNLHIPLIVNIFSALGDAFPCKTTDQQAPVK